MLFLKKLWAGVKEYWAIALLVLGAIVAFFLLRKKDISFADRFNEIRDIHDKELETIQDVREEEQRQHEANRLKLEATLEVVQANYDDAMKELDSKKKKEIAEIVKQHKGNPDSLAKKLSEATGFKVIFPED
jgi:c-di-AMP phosphodiesterase-like protein